MRTFHSSAPLRTKWLSAEIKIDWGFILSILEKVNSSADVKKLSADELIPLCAEIREKLVESVSRTGGHLASNLGCVELSVALHRVYDSKRDRIVFDVGHQSYTHKILTGRRDDFDSLRQFGGISGFPKPSESEDDAFIAGHASNSVSVALGMAHARTLKHENYDVVAVIGDGALSGGLAYEGLMSAAVSHEPMVIILNDNNMSINENVGGIARLLQNLRLKKSYISFKRWYISTFSRYKGLYSVSSAVKDWFKDWLLPKNIFDIAGLYYLGPVDGHDIAALERVISWAKELKRTTIVHVLTKKGKGYDYAEEHPDIYHGVNPFDKDTGISAGSGSACFADKMGEYLCRQAEKDESIVAITAAMTNGTGLDGFAKSYPERFFDVGIAEGNAVAMAAGLAKQGMKPVFAVYSTFLQRGYDMLIHDVSLQKLHAVFAVDRAGITGRDGDTHNGTFDVSYLCSVPNMTVLCPASYAELHDMLDYALNVCDGPVAVRYPRGGEGRYVESHMEPETLLREGGDLTIVAYGILTNEALSAAESLEKDYGISAEVIKLGIIKPNTFELTMKSLEKTGRLLVIEDVCESGSVGENISSQAELRGLRLKGVRLLNSGTGLVQHGSVDELYHMLGLDCEGICKTAMELWQNNEEDKT